MCEWVVFLGNAMVGWKSVIFCSGKFSEFQAKNKHKKLVLRIRDVYPGSWFLPIPDPGSKNSSKREGGGVKKNSWHTFFCSHKFHIIEHYFIFEMLKKKLLVNFQRIIELFTQKIFTKLSKIWVRDPEKPIPDPGSRGQKSTGSRIRVRNTAKNIKNIINGSAEPSPMQERIQELVE